MKGPRLKECILYDSICIDSKNLALSYSVQGCICLWYNYKIYMNGITRKIILVGMCRRSNESNGYIRYILLGPGSFLFLLRRLLQDAQ